MIQTLILFGVCLALGVLARLWFVGLLRTEKRMGRPAVIALEFLSMGLLSTIFCIILFFLSDGIFMPFTLIALIIGFIATSIFI